MKSLKGKKGMKKGHFGDGPRNTGMEVALGTRAWVWIYNKLMDDTTPIIHFILVFTVVGLLCGGIVSAVLYGLLLLLELYRRKKGIKDEDNDN